MPVTPFTLSECICKHCYTCGAHHGASGKYCEDCMLNHYDLVEKDAKIRGLSGDNRDHRFWLIDHPEQGKDA
jgi:hypothetical protein